MMLMMVRLLSDLPPNPGPSSAGLPSIAALSTVFGVHDRHRGAVGERRLRAGPVMTVDDAGGTVDWRALADALADRLRHHEHDGTGYCSPDDDGAEKDAVVLSSYADAVAQIPDGTVTFNPDQVDALRWMVEEWISEGFSTPPYTSEQYDIFEALHLTGVRGISYDVTRPDGEGRAVIYVHDHEELKAAIDRLPDTRRHE